MATRIKRKKTVDNIIDDEDKSLAKKGDHCYNIIAMSVAHGSLPKFDPSKETWTLYAECLNLYLQANDIVDPTKKRSILLTACGPDAYKTVRSLLQPHKPTDKSYEELGKILQAHYHPPPSPFLSRFKFHTHVRQPSESITTFVAQLKELAQHCGFGDQLENMVRDRIVVGINDPRIQHCLLQETDITFDNAFKIAQSMELSAKESSMIQAGLPREQPVHRVQQQQSRARQPSAPSHCYRCGGSHPSATCRFRQAECHACGIN